MSGGTRVARRRAAVVRELLDTAWALIERDGVAAVTMRELAARIGVQPQSLSGYFPSKAALLDALFREGFTQATQRLSQLPQPDDPRQFLVSSVNDFLAFCVENPGRFHLMLQRSVPGFTPSPKSLETSALSLQIMLDRAAAAGIRSANDVILLRALISGLASEQLANEPGGQRFISQAERAVALLLDSIDTATTNKPDRPGTSQATKRARGTRPSPPATTAHKHRDTI